MRQWLCKNVSYTCFFLLAFLFMNSPKTDAQVVFNVNTSTPGASNQVIAEISVENFTNIASLQFTVQWDPTSLQFDSVGGFNLPDLKLNNFGLSNNTLISTGKLIFFWIDETLTGINLNDGSPVFYVYLTALNSNNLNVCISNNPAVIEVTDGNTVIPYAINCQTGTFSFIEGSVFNDQNSDCQLATGEGRLANWTVIAEKNGLQKFATTDANGFYRLFVAVGDYQISAIPPIHYWSPCQVSYLVQVTSTNQIYMQDMGLQSETECPFMEVSVSAPFLRRCFPSTYHVNYCNKGTIDASNTYVEVTLDPYMTMLSSSIPWSSTDGQTYTFPLGDVAAGDCGSFHLSALIDCNTTVIGQTHCTKAHIYPDEFCSALPWTGASIETTGECSGDSIIFLIKNVGQASMTAERNYIVIEDAVMYRPQPFQLDSGEEIRIPMKANGKTFRLRADQEPDHPGNSTPTVAIEGCGTDAQGNFSTGFVTIFAENDGDAFIDFDCQENRGSFDPNDKQGFPKGAGTEKYVDQNTDLEYMIRFQNTGTDTAFNVVILDTLSSFLDAKTVSPGSSSHHYDFEILGEGVLRFSFRNIMLPDSNINEPGSHGFVHYRVRQQKNVALQSKIYNEAAIYFDFNPPVITNEVLHTVGKDFLQVVSSQQIFEQGVKISVTPNPISEKAVFEITGKEMSDGFLKIFDLKGKPVFEKRFAGQQVVLQKDDLAGGFYFYKIETDGKIIGTGKFVIQ